MWRDRVKARGPASGHTLNVVDDADEKCQKMAKDLAELSMLMAVGPDKDGVQQAARSMLRALETRYDNKMFDP